MRKSIKIDTLTSVDIVELVKYRGFILEEFEGFFCQNLEYIPYTELLLICLTKEIYLIHRKRFTSKPS